MLMKIIKILNTHENYERINKMWNSHENYENMKYSDKMIKIIKYEK